MPGKLLNWLWSMRFQFIKYAVIGTSGVVLDMFSLYLLKEYGQMRPVVAVVINQIFILNYIFFLNKYWSFQSSGMTGRQMMRFFIVACWNYLFAIFWMWFFNERNSVNYLLARILNIMLAVSWNFLLYKYFVYRAASSVNKSMNPVSPLSAEKVIE